MINLTFDHSQDSLLTAMGIDKNTYDRALSKIFFYSLSRPSVAQDLYGVDILLNDEHNVPREMVSKSAVLELSLKAAESLIEQTAMLFVFEIQFNTSQEILSMYSAHSRLEDIKAKFAEEGKLNPKMELAMLLFQHKARHVVELKEIFELINASSGNYTIFKSLIPEGDQPILFLLGKLKNILNTIDSERDSEDTDDE